MNPRPRSRLTDPPGYRTMSGVRPLPGIPPDRRGHPLPGAVMIVNWARSPLFRCFGLASVWVGLCGGTPAHALEPSKPAAPDLRPFLERHCFDCHGPDTAKADLRLDTLAADFSAGEKVRLWTKVLDRLEAGEMPP